MKSSPLPTSPNRRPRLPGPRTGRRRLVVGAGVAAGAALAAAALQRKRRHRSRRPPRPRPTRLLNEGYRLTDHVRRYYETTRT